MAKLPKSRPTGPLRSRKGDREDRDTMGDFLKTLDARRRARRKLRNKMLDRKGRRFKNDKQQDITSI